MNILIADKVSPDMISEMESLGGKVTYIPELTAEALPASVGDAALLVVRSTKVSAATIEAGTHLRLIVRAGAGVNTIALDAASDRSIYVANCPGMNTDAVAELAIGLLIAADRQIANATVALREGKWLKGEFGKARGLLGRTLGVVGLGQIGLATVKRAQALGMHVMAWSRSLTAEQAEALGIEYAATPVALAAQADAVSVHLAATVETKHLLGATFFDAMKPGSILVNTARGDVVDSDALLTAISEKGIRVGLDVFENEPAGGKADFAQTALADHVVCTPHIGASTDQASQAISTETVRIVSTFMRTGQAINVVNLRPPVSDKTHLVVRHYNRVGVLARTLTALRDQGINVEEMQDAVFQTGAAACCSLTLDSLPTEATLARIDADVDVIAVEL
jgi:D-3-phosphoglycerate dehydrogenase / 2-oxoglutarate reductase